MKKLLFLLTLFFLFAPSCSKNSKSKGKGFEAQPNDMIYVPRGSFEMGSNDEDVVWAMNAPLKRRTVDGFWMDQTEVTNRAYRQFVQWTADSVQRRMLAEGGVDGFVVESDYDDEEDEPENLPLNYKTKLAGAPKQKGFDDQYPVLKDGGYYYSKGESLGQKRAVDVRKLYYEHKWFDLHQAAKARWDPKEERYVGKVIDSEGNVADVVDRSSFIMKEKIPVYPDTLVWIRDFHFSFNDPLAISYFSHPAYDYYPVVGVSWKQATAYCDWKTQHVNEKKYKNQYMPHAYRLPMEVEYEYAARGGLDGNLYPWGSLYNTNRNGCFLANFKPQRGDYALDGFTRTAPVAQYEPNDFGLYDMSGNVSEWVGDAYDENSYESTHDLVPIYHHDVKEKDKMTQRRKCLRGGSWKDVSYFLQCGARDYEYQDSARSYVGFRTVRDAPVLK